MDLTNPTVIRAVMQKHGKQFAKSLGQNFLTDAGVLDAIVEGSGIGAQTDVLEIGPGIGVLTARLCRSARRVVAVELDEKLLPVLDETLAEFRNVEIVQGDILKTDIGALVQEHFGGNMVQVAANLPYYITSPILMRLIEAREWISSITVMVQKEVAERIAAPPGGKDYGVLSVAVQYYGSVELLTEVPPESFLPPPKVSSAVIRIHLLPQPSVRTDETLFFKIVKASFAQRRKTLVNSLSAGMSCYGKDVIRAALEQIGLPETVRAERLSLEEFAKLTNLLGNN
ncbi:MAG: 16S rRNA (adenine(1518)-N(6)/adenine(1519)-N(6))-dimethyltransferase RsmA [Clostridia bacterium]|nr:16S rRNA (adenine(1518)-N(6)/adenine(1519)-N(6))-dimethyltransferase RsmA [Clostridia bacterium]